MILSLKNDIFKNSLNPNLATSYQSLKQFLFPLPSIIVCNSEILFVPPQQSLTNQCMTTAQPRVFSTAWQRYWGKHYCHNPNSTQPKVGFNMKMTTTSTTTTTTSTTTKTTTTISQLSLTHSISNHFPQTWDS